MGLRLSCVWRAAQVALTVFYSTATEMHSTTFFNRTIDIVEPPRWVDTELLMMLATVGAILSIAGAHACLGLHSVYLWPRWEPTSAYLLKSLWHRHGGLPHSKVAVIQHAKGCGCFAGMSRTCTIP